jgi:hypothetical protein
MSGRSAASNLTQIAGRIGQPGCNHFCEFEELHRVDRSGILIKIFFRPRFASLRVPFQLSVYWFAIGLRRVTRSRQNRQPEGKSQQLERDAFLYRRAIEELRLIVGVRLRFTKH